MIIAFFLFNKTHTYIAKKGHAKSMNKRSWVSGPGSVPDDLHLPHLRLPDLVVAVRDKVLPHFRQCVRNP